MCAYVIQSWLASNEPVDESKHLVAIRGRNEGFISWLLTRLQISPTISLEICPDQLQIRAGSLSGQIHRTVPLENICATAHGWHRPWREASLLFGSIAVLGSFLGARLHPIAPVLILVLGAVTAAAYYLLNQSLTLGFTETSGHTTTLHFRRTRLDGETIDEHSAAYVAELTHVLMANRKESAAATTP